LADLLTHVRRDIDRRLAELRPVLDEVHRLEKAWEALAGTNVTPRRSRADREGSKAKRTRMTKARSQEVDQRVLALLSADSTQKPSALATLTDTSVGSMNSRLNRLVREGALRKRRRGGTSRYEVTKPRRSGSDRPQERASGA
jgi:hypothetical protein